MKQIFISLAIVVLNLPPLRAVSGHSEAQIVIGGGNSVSIEELKDHVKDGLSTVSDDLFIEGVLVSLFACGNLEVVRNDTFTSLSTSDENRTAYVQNPDGSAGIGLHFIASKFANIPQYSKVKINLKGAELKLVRGVGLSAYNLGETAVVSVVPGSREDVVIKEKTISQLNDSDVFTYVRIKDCECVFKDGAYGNIYEKYSSKCELNKECAPFSMMDCWSSLLCDKVGDRLNMLMNCAPVWRRNGKGVLQGMFDIEGIVVCAELPRYGTENLSRYQIRPMSEDALRPDASERTWETLCEWNWNNPSDRDFAPADGVATMTCNVPSASYSRSVEMNNPKIISAKDNPGFAGVWKDGALRITARACDWWDWKENRANGLCLTFSAGAIEAEKAYVAFSFCGGILLDALKSVNYPSFWTVEYSFDGKNFSRMEDRTATMHSMVWRATRPINGLTYHLSGEAAMGFTEHMFVFPENISGKDKVYVRIVPASRNLATLAHRGGHARANRPEYTPECTVNFGSIIVRYR